MVREGTRSQTGNSRPRVFATVDTQPTIKRTRAGGGARKTKAAGPAATKGSGAGVTKKKTPAKKTGAAAGKVSCLLCYALPLGDMCLGFVKLLWGLRGFK